MRNLSVIVIGVLISLVACKPKTPSKYIQPDEIVDILVDYHLSRAMGQMQGTYEEQNYNRSLYWNAVMRKYDITQEKFDSSMAYYYGRSDIFDDIYKQVYDRLNEQYTLKGISEGEIGKFAALKAEGDTANIWPGQLNHFMMPTPPYDCLNFSIAADTSFYEGDTFLMQFMSDFVYQSGSRDAMLYVAVLYPDTTIVRQLRFAYSGLTQLHIDSPVKAVPRTIKGFVHVTCGPHPSSTLHMLFINNIQLIRFHKKHEKPAKNQADSLSRDSTAGRTVAAPVGSGDSSGQGDTVLSSARRTSPNRVVERIDSLKSSR